MTDFWQDRTVMVTGGCGMVGYQLVRLLKQRQARVVVLTNKLRPEVFVDGVSYVVGDAGNTEFVGLRISTYQPSVLLNLAASVSGIFYNLDNQGIQFWRNMRLQFAPLVAATRLAVPVFVQVSTVCIYDPRYNVDAREKDGHRGEPTTGYAWAKRMGERLVWWTPRPNEECRRVIVRPTNMYGEHDKFGQKVHVIPAFIKTFISSPREPVTLLGDGSQTREFMHAEDGARGIMAAAEYGRDGEAYNLGTDGRTRISIRALAEKIKDITGATNEIVPNVSMSPLDQDRSINSQKAYEELNWRYRIDLDTGLHRVIDWYRTSRHRRGIEVDE